MGDVNELSDVAGRLPGAGFSILPTPLHSLDMIGSLLGARIWCKRDDLTGFAFGGNKTRKLDYLIQDAVDSGCDSIVTFGSSQSNWCRMTAAAAGRCGLDAYLFLAGREPERATANLVLDRLAGAHIEHIDSDSESDLVGACTERSERLKKAGRRPYYMAVGGSNPIGCTGYIRAMGEIIDWEQKSGESFSRIFVASGSAGTQAGLVAGKIISGWQGDIIGISVSRQAVEQQVLVGDLVKETLLFHGYRADEKLIQKAVIVDDNYLGEGYRVNTHGCLEAIRLFARHEGIFLDEVYTGKAADGLIGWIKNGSIGGDDKTLFIHTGGAVQLFE